MDFFTRVSRTVVRTAADLTARIRNSGTIITINSAVDYEKLPHGFFIVKLGNGKEMLGYNDPPVLLKDVDADGKPVERLVASTFGFAWPVCEVVNTGGRIVRLEISRTALPSSAPTSGGQCRMA